MGFRCGVGDGMQTCHLLSYKSQSLTLCRAPTAHKLTGYYPATMRRSLNAPSLPQSTPGSASKSGQVAELQEPRLYAQGWQAYLPPKARPDLLGNLEHETWQCRRERRAEWGGRPGRMTGLIGLVLLEDHPPGHTKKHLAVPS